MLTNSETKPAFFDIDARAFYEFGLDPLKLVAFLRVFNLLDIRNEIDVYDDTGRAGFTLDEQQARLSARQVVNTLDQWFTQSRFYSEPRRVEFGINLEF